jgi:hypothetical protein
MFSLRRLPCTFHPDPCLASATSPSALETPCIRKSRRWSRSTALYAANLPHDVAPQFSCDAGAPRLSDGMRRRSRGASIKVSTPTTRVAPAWWPNRAPTAGRFGDLPTPLIGALDLLDLWWPSPLLLTRTFLYFPRLVSGWISSENCSKQLRMNFLISENCSAQLPLQGLFGRFVSS